MPNGTRMTISRIVITSSDASSVHLTRHLPASSSRQQQLHGDEEWTAVERLETDSGAKPYAVLTAASNGGRAGPKEGDAT